MKKGILIILLSASSAFAGAIMAIKWLDRSDKENVRVVSTSFPNDSFVPISSTIPLVDFLPEGTVDFVMASARSTASVVFIQTTSEYEYRSGAWLDWFFDDKPSSQISAGSGVILSENGYIITNNHVIEDADKITVISGKKTYEAQLVGRDPSTDLAVIKIDELNLSAIALGNSDELNVGEWVLAVGNPFNLTSTVTAGIVSAKGRNINAEYQFGER